MCWLTPQSHREAVSWYLTPASLPRLLGYVSRRAPALVCNGGKVYIAEVVCSHTVCWGPWREFTPQAAGPSTAQHGAHSFCSEGPAHGFIVHIKLNELCNLLK